MPIEDRQRQTVGPLQGIKVIDMTRVVAGPLAGQTLADLGADVIKIERLGEGDDIRTLGPPWLQDEKGHDSDHSTYFLAVNRGKRSLAIDFTKPEGAAVLRKLVAKADVLLENFRPGTLAKYGLSYEQVSEGNPGIIYCSVTGFGHSGPYSPRSGYDYLVQAMGGGMSVTGHADGEPGAGPMRVGVPLADFAAGNNAALGILAALLARHQTGRGQHVDIALMDSQVGMLLNSFSGWLNGQKLIPRMGNDHASAVPYGVFPCSDGFILICTFNDREFARLAEALGHAEWPVDPRFARSRDRVVNRRTLVEAISEVTRTLTRDTLMAVMEEAKISCGPINTMKEVEIDPQVDARGMIVEMDHPVAGKIRVAGSPLKLSDTPVQYNRRPPMVGEHSVEVLSELGLSADEIAALKAHSIIEG